MPGTFPRHLCVDAIAIPVVTDEKTKMKKDEGTCPKSHSTENFRQFCQAFGPCKGFFFSQTSLPAAAALGSFPLTPLGTGLAPL